MSNAPSNAAARGVARYAALDGLRGVAALCVVQHHVLQSGCYQPEPVFVEAVFQGYFSVLVFFVLSGFALSAALERKHAYQNWLARRALRLYPPVLATVGLYLLAETEPAIRSITYSKAGFILPAPHSIQNAVNAALLILGHPGGVLWSMAVEVRASIVMPLVKMLTDWLNARPASVLVTMATVAGSEVAATALGWEGLLTRWAQASYLLLFLTGALLFANREIVTRLSEKAAWIPRTIAVLALAIMFFAHAGAAGEYGGWHLAALKLAAILAVVCVVGGGVPKGFLTSKPIAFLGAVSYSLYLCHSLVIEGLRVTWPGLFAVAPAFNCVCLAVSVGLAWLLFLGIERPTTSWSRRFAK